MKKLCPIRDLATYALLFVITLFSHQAMSDELSSLEASLLTAWIQQPELRDDISTVYWASVEQQLSEVKETLPLEVNDFAVIIDITLVNKTTTYFIIVSADMVQHIPKKKFIVDHMCSGKQTALYLTIFDGSIKYIHYKEGQREAYSIMSITGADCGSGI